MSTRRIVSVTAVALALTLGAHAQSRPLKVLILYDMEGVSGASQYEHTTTTHPEQYAAGRKALTADVNAAIAGLKAGGATEIVVVDGHGSGNTQEPDVFENQLLPPARMIARDRSFDIYMDSYDQSFDAVVAVAMHAGAGNGTGFLSHTYTFEDIEYKVNGVPFNETMILAMGAARLKIPLIMVSGDDQLEKEVRRNLPWVKYAAVKHAVSRAKAEPLAPDEVARRIETAAREAIQQIDAAKLPDASGPFRFALTFQDEAQARNAALQPGAETLANPAVVQIRARDFEEGYRQSLRLISLAGIVGYSTALQRVLAAQPNAAVLRGAVTDWEYARWLNQLLAAPPAPAPATATRYWGAR
jgi:D-amino peptidase